MSIENPQALVQQVLDYMDSALKTRVGAFLDVALQTLHDQGHAESGGQASSRAAERWLKENRAGIATRFPQRMREAFLGRAPAHSVSVDELQLLEDSALVNVIVRARIVAVMEKARLAAATLDPRLDALYEAGGRINARSLAPGVVADEFVAVLNELSVVKYIQLPLIEVYGLCGVEMLIDVYDDLNQLLMQQGVLPDYKTRIARDLMQSPAGSGGPALAMSSGKTWDPADQSAESPTPAPIAEEKILATQQALAALTVDDWRPGKLRELSEAVLSSEQVQAIAPVEAIFLPLLRDTSISHRFRAEMSRLVLPLLLLPPAEAASLANPEHAVRRFLRQLAILGMRDQQTPLHDYKSINAIIARIAAERGSDVNRYHQGADTLVAIAKNEVQRQLTARKNETQAS